MGGQLVHSKELSIENRNVDPKNEFPELGLPGVESVPTPCGVILRAFPMSMGPKKTKIQIFVAAPPQNRVQESPKRAVYTSHNPECRSDLLDGDQGVAMG